MNEDAGRPTLGFRSVLRNRQYVVFLASANSSAMGYSVYSISIVWLTYTLTHDFLVVGAVLAIEAAAYTATFLFGPIVDRVRNQRTIFLWSYPVQAAAAAVLGWGFVARFVTEPLLFGLVAAISLLWDMTWAAANAAPGVLLSPDEQFAASGVSGALGGGLSILGYALGGALILAVGADGGMFLYAGLLVAATLLAVPLRISPPTGPERSFAESFREGWRFVTGGRGRPLLQLAAVDSIVGFLTFAPALLITLLATTIYHGSPTGYGVLFVADVAGGVLAGLALGRWNPRGRVGLVLGISLLVAAVSVVVAVALPAVLVLGAIAWFAVGFASSSYLDAKYAFYRGAVPPERIARLVSNMYLFAGAASTVGALVLGGLATSGNPWPLGLAAGAAYGLAGLGALLLPGVRQMRY